MRKISYDNLDAVLEKIINGDVRSVSKVLTAIERRDLRIFPLLKKLYSYTGTAKLLGVTGPAGVGKSTLINRLITAYRKKKKSVGVLAVDPSSPLSGGAILGDRLRMHEHFLDKGVFIRSLATQGTWGGISPALFEAIHVLDAMGKDLIIIETIGVGQDEVRIAQLAQIVLLVLTPGMGDVVQTLKAGLLEIGDMIVLNKADLLQEGQLLETLEETKAGRPVLHLSAESGSGCSGLISHINEAFKKRDVLDARRECFVREELQSLLYEKLRAEGKGFPFTDHLIREIRLRKKDPYSSIESWDKNEGWNKNENRDKNRIPEKSKP
ncbi:YgfD: protein that forms a complex with the methylmalonyl-CoA mutase in a pathway for conversion of succinyl-CoA to propionyl-CoA [hydrothermal vent metagenome]|uniref:YgfD: protein that forms a complex with the methylmalonyl-CoA mutase in a pathway for conversion of succinyl-CoA to propionyl-CoA n=1 Tax=hydrothermal vent metagenome TaxID=652676 RepID=A0A3B1CZC4_9ZZZZ